MAVTELHQDMRGLVEQKVNVNRVCPHSAVEVILEGSVPEDGFHQGLVSSVKRRNCQLCTAVFDDRTSFRVKGLRPDGSKSQFHLSF